jgi:Mannosyltransferase OCH1 and related enzymes
MSADSKQDMKISYNLPVKDISVNITAVNEPIPKYTTKITMDQLLLAKSRFCNGVWMWPCHRCLKSALHGSYEKCSWVCSSCLNMMYDRSAQNDKTDNDDDQTVHVNIHVDGYHLDSSKYKFIPRIIHQTWFEYITPTNYPYLYRLQNQWKMSGWEYRFYTDDTARQYIIDHYPLHFLEAYDALIPGAYKADLFRYMLLLREGGVYADVDVMLEASLDQFVTPGMSFFTPRDCVAEFADGQYCLWNGIIGVAPGHPIIVRAVERLVNAILKRSDLLDLEKEVAQKSGVNTETWKVRAVQELLLSGPCALGIAVNEVLGRNSLTRFGVGWINDHIDNNQINPQQFGDMMILMVSLFETWKCKRLLSFQRTNFFLLSKINKTWVQCALQMSRED